MFQDEALDVWIDHFAPAASAVDRADDLVFQVEAAFGLGQRGLVVASRHRRMAAGATAGVGGVFIGFGAKLATATLG